MTKASKSSLVIDIINLQSKVQRRMSGALTPHGIGLTEYLVLHQLSLAANHSMRRIDLAERIGLSPSGITRLLNPMQKIGLITKEVNPRDARVSLVALSSAGKRIYGEANISFAHASNALFEAFDAKQIKALEGLLTTAA
ncbi:Transcriptional regulator SlyA [Halioglobus japonicus]|nr:Transcriptional regulator SlyA [Halioglobus japonicus]